MRRSSGPTSARIAQSRKSTPPKYANCRGATQRSPRRSRPRPRPGSKPSPLPPRRSAPTRGRGPQSGYRALSVASREFGASQAARRETRRNSGQGEELSLNTLLRPYENASDRALIRKTSAVDIKLLASADAAVRTVSSLGRIAGFPRAGGEEPKQISVGHGRTAAGTRFEVSAGTYSSSLGGNLDSCHRSATVAYTRPGAPEVLIVGGPNNPICLFPPHYR